MQDFRMIITRRSFWTLVVGAGDWKW